MPKNEDTRLVCCSFCGKTQDEVQRLKRCEADAESDAYTRGQFDLFCRMIDAVAQRGGVTFAIRHCANTGAVVHYPEMALDDVINRFVALAKEKKA